MTCGIYLITTVDGLRYVGKSINIEKRIKGHKWRSLMHSWQTLEECSLDSLDEAEWDWIERLKPELNRVVPVVNSSGKRRWDNLGVKESSRSRFGDRPQHSAPSRHGHGMFNRLNEFIVEKGISRYQFAKQIGIAFNTIYGLCGDRSRIPDVTVMVKICNAYPDTKPNDLMGFCDSKRLS